MKVIDISWRRRRGEKEKSLIAGQRGAKDYMFYYAVQDSLNLFTEKGLRIFHLRGLAPKIPKLSTWIKMSL